MTDKWYNSYRWWWRRIGGRKWTFIMRDTWHKYEGLCIIGLVAIGAVLGLWLWELIFWFLLVFALGYIAGHLFWGKDYIPNQDANNSMMSPGESISNYRRDWRKR